MTLQHISLFSGVGGIDLAMADAGIPTIAACEIDKHARGVLHDRFPDTYLFTDVREVTGDALRALGADPRRTVLSAGFPCQDLSVAGNRRGMVEGSGTRSALYWEIDRILAEFNPAWIILENVPGLLSSRGGRDMGAVLGSLAKRGYGYAYRVLDAQHFGVPQRRRRVIIVGRAGGDGRAPAEILLEPESLPGNPTAGITPRKITAGAATASPGVSSVFGGAAPRLAATLTAGTSSPGVGAPGRRQEDDHNLVAFALRGREDGAVPEVHGDGSQVGALRAAGGGSSRDYVASVCNPLTASGGDRGYRIDAESAAGGQLITLRRGTRSGIRTAVRRLTPLECERLQGHPDSHTATSWGKPQSDSQRYKQMGNGVAVPVFEWVSRRLAAVHTHIERSSQ